MNSTQEYYNEIAKGYDELYGEEQLKKLALIKNNVPNPKSLLDIGCGTCLASKVFFESNYFGVEPAKELVLNSKCKDYFNIENISFLKAEDFEIKRKFDLILIVSVIHHIKDLDEFFKKVQSKCYFLVVSVLNRMSSKEKIVESFSHFFSIKKKINESKDDIYFLQPKSF